MIEKFNFSTKLQVACSKDKLRPALQCVHFSCGYAYASDGHCIIKQALQWHSIINPELLDGKCLHRDSYEAILKFTTATAQENGIECKNEEGSSAFFPYFDLKDVKTPDFDRLLSDIESENIPFIGVNLEVISKCLNAFYSPSNQFRLRFQGVSKAICIDVPGIEEQIGIVMPITLQDSLF